MKRKEQIYKGEFKKEANYELVLESLNNSLAVAQEEFLDTEIENKVNIHIIGVPRSGTTLINQYLSSYMNVGYINNFIATFWRAPIFGIEIAKKTLKLDYLSNFESKFGRTDNIMEPHEFGYFWNENLKYPNLMEKSPAHELNVDWSHLNMLLNNMVRAFDKPILFKSFLLGFHSFKQYTTNNKSVFIYINRDRIETAHSILKLRNNLLGDEELWGSIMPKEYSILKELDKFKQIAGQVYFLNKSYKTQLAQIPSRNVIYVDYNSFCASPKGVLDLINSKVLSIENGYEVKGVDASKVQFKPKQADLRFLEEFRDAFAYIEDLDNKLYT